MQTRFDGLLDLARLPYFEVRDGHLVLADASLGPTVDVHTHLALSYILPATVDLLARHDEVEHYLPKERALDLDIYVNKNFSDADLSRLKRDLTFGALHSGGMRRTHTAPNLLREMAELGIRSSVLLPIEFPVLSNNAERWLKATAGDPGFVGFGSVHPLMPNVAKRLDQQIALGARGIKFHPAVQLISPSHPKAMALYRLCAARKLTVLFHCGPVGIETAAGRKRSLVRLYEPAIAENPDVSFILGHSGALQMEEALAFSKRYPNVWLEVSSQSVTNVGRILDEAPQDRVLFGTDWPFYHQAIVLAKVYLATESRPEARRRVLYDNAASLFGLPTP